MQKDITRTSHKLHIYLRLQHAMKLLYRVANVFSYPRSVSSDLNLLFEHKTVRKQTKKIPLNSFDTLNCKRTLINPVPWCKGRGSLKNLLTFPLILPAVPHRTSESTVCDLKICYFLTVTFSPAWNNLSAKFSNIKRSCNIVI